MMNKYFYFALAVLVSCAVSYGLGKISGKEASEREHLIEYNKTLSQNLDRINSIDKQLNEQSLVLNKIRGEISGKQTEVIKEVVKYTENPANSNRCLDTNWVRIYNKSLPTQRTKNIP